MTYNFTGQDVVSTVRDIANEYPEFVYEAPSELGGQCLYAHSSENGYTPGCLMGQALYRLGVDLSALQPYEGEGIEEVLEHLNISSDSDSRLWLSEVQTAQDESVPWGLAVNPVDSEFA